MKTCRERYLERLREMQYNHDADDDRRTCFSRVMKQTFLSLTQIVKWTPYGIPRKVIQNWMRSKNAISHLSDWETNFNPNFRGLEFEAPLFPAPGERGFTMSPTKWIAKTNAIGIIVTNNPSVGTFAHPDIAEFFATWLFREEPSIPHTTPQ